jgi:hypothetical protein
MESDLEGAVPEVEWGSVVGAPTSQEVSCFTFCPPHPSWENRASRTEFSCSSCLLVEPLLARAEEGSEGGKPLPAAAAHEVMAWGAPGPGACWCPGAGPTGWDPANWEDPELSRPIGGRVLSILELCPSSGNEGRL